MNDFEISMTVANAPFLLIDMGLLVIFFGIRLVRWVLDILP